jgi:hypothetical protein
VPIAEQMDLILPNVIRPEPFRRTAEMLGELLGDLDVGAYGILSVIPTLEFISIIFRKRVTGTSL